MADGLERAVARGRHQTEPIDHERVLHAREQALGQAVEVEVGVQLAGEAHQRAPVVVAIAVEHAVDRALHAVLHRLGQQQHHDGGQRGDDPAVVVFGRHEEATSGPHDHHIDGGNRTQRRGVDQQALEDDLDVHQPVAHDRRRERQGHEPERHGRELHRERRRGPKRERHRVGEHERPGPNGRAPHDPTQLPQRRGRPHAPERRGEDGESAQQIGRQIERLHAIERGDRAYETGGIFRGPHERYRPGQPEQRGHRVEQRPAVAGQRRQHAVARPLGKDQGEVHEQRRQQERRHLVGPVEHPVHAIEAAGEGEGEDAVERDGEPEEVQRRLIVGTARSHGGADEQREDAHGGEHVVEATHAAGDGSQCHLGHAAVAERQ